MFLKPVKVKSNNQLKGTERKKLCEDVVSAFPSLTDSDVQNLLPKKEAISFMKVVTHSGEICKLYCVAKIPMFFQLDQSTIPLFPTIYTLWQHPNLLYTFKTHRSVIPKLASGASLMLPGVILDGPPTFRSYGKLEKNTPVSVITEDNIAAVAVGVTSHSSEDMYMSGGRGKCVDILHVIGDMICQLGKPPARPQLDPAPEKIDETTDNQDSNESIDVSDNKLDSADAKELTESINTTDNENNSNETVQTNEETLDLIDEEVDPVKEMDKLLEYCFLKACKVLKKSELPLLSSSFFKNHLIVACPSGQVVDIKKSSYKKLSVFLADMKAKGVIDTTILKGVESITYIKTEHSLLKELVINESAEASQLNKSSNTPVVAECFKVTADVLPVLSKFGYEKGDVMKRPEIRKCFTEYVKKENLQDGKILKINPQLADILRTKESVLTLTMEDGINKFIGRMTHTHEITVAGTKLLHTGKLEPIDITVASRCNNKKVTLVNNLEMFGIKLDEFSKECQVIGASATITDIPGKKTPSVLVQGNQVLYVYKLLTDKYRINKNYIRGLEFAPKKRK
ncbi:eukaryotic translation initiation factor 2D [Microplitis mediator]|uniref:eukaryotic translation initiation factor 2D n=1 Tax=Microplitis mediator TaxID=375433 RepID=UPI0025568134|nr:eukaryotic translation initiation factor 2D [Microplitis mediator]